MKARTAVLALASFIAGCEHEAVAPVPPANLSAARATVTAATRAPTVIVGPAGAVITALGDTLRLEAMLFDETGHSVEGAAFTWSSSDANIATVESTGLVTAIGEGRATIKATANGGEGSSKIVIVDAARAAGTDRAALIALYAATDGPHWKNDSNWLTDAPLRQWYGVSAVDGRVVELYLASNGLTGTLPAEVAEFDKLESLSLQVNGLTGPIPAELGHLAQLRALTLYLNHLTGMIPPELAHASQLENLNLSGNYLTGSIPPELASLSRLRGLLLVGNGLTGPIPPELGKLYRLGELALADNNLTGSVPAEIGQLSDLQHLKLHGNRHLSGTLPAELMRLDRIKSFTALGTDLCLPLDPAFQAWAQTILELEIADCSSHETAIQHPVYLTQAIQSRERPVPLVADEKALLRVFYSASRHDTVFLPGVRAHFYLDDSAVYTAEIPAHSVLVSNEVREDHLLRSSNAEIPGTVIRPGLSMVVEIDTTGIDPALGIAPRIPATGRVALDVRRLPALDLTVIPFLWDADPHWGAVTAAQAMERDAAGYELLHQTRTLLPVGDIRVTAHPPVLTSISPDEFYDLFDLTKAIQVIEGGTGRYMGTMSRPGRTGRAGSAEHPGRVLIARLNPFTIAHELGHTMSLYHAPACRAGGADPDFPDRYGSIGAWGYDFRAGNLVPPHLPDVMSYCDPSWVSDYHFANALRFRLDDEGAAPPAAGEQMSPSLLLWGGSHPDGTLYLNPAFALDATPTLPDSDGEHQITGRSANGDTLFTVGFDLPVIADGDGSSAFAFALPVESGWSGHLTSITLSGPNGSARLGPDTDIPTSMLLDASTGQVRGILRTAPQAYGAASAHALPPEGTDRLVTLFSRGIPDAR